MIRKYEKHSIEEISQHVSLKVLRTDGSAEENGLRILLVLVDKQESQCPFVAEAQAGSKVGSR